MRISDLFPLIVLLFLACSQIKTSSCLSDFKMQIRDSVDLNSIDFSSINCFRWDSLMLLAPYHYDEQVREETGIIIPPNLSSVNSEDGFLIFILNNRPQQIIRVKKGALDITGYIRNNVFSCSYMIMAKEDCKELATNLGQ